MLICLVHLNNGDVNTSNFIENILLLKSWVIITKKNKKKHSSTNNEIKILLGEQQPLRIIDLQSQITNLRDELDNKNTILQSQQDTAIDNFKAEQDQKYAKDLQTERDRVNGLIDNLTSNLLKYQSQMTALQQQVQSKCHNFVVINEILKLDMSISLALVTFQGRPYLSTLK